MHPRIRSSNVLGLSSSRTWKGQDVDSGTVRVPSVEYHRRVGASAATWPDDCASGRQRAEVVSWPLMAGMLAFIEHRNQTAQPFNSVSDAKKQHDHVRRTSARHHEDMAGWRR